MSDRHDDEAPAGYGPPEDAMTYDETSDDLGRGRMVLALAVVMVCAAIAILYVVFQQGVRKGGRNAPPTIVAETGPEKSKPDNPGGMEVPDQDKTVFDRVSGETTERVEKLLPEPEEPIDIAGLRTSTDQALEKADPVTIDPAKEEPALETPADNRAAIDTAPTPTAKPTPPADNEEMKEAENIGDLIDSLPGSTDVGNAVASVDKNTVNTASGAVGPATSGAYVVQVASLPEAEAATRIWENLLRKNQDILSVKRPDIQMADLGDKGIYYRLRIGPFATKEEAQRMCDTLKSRGQDCLLRKTS